MSESTVKRVLLEEEAFTPAKLLVAREINSWAETNAKGAVFQPMQSMRAHSQHHRLKAGKKQMFRPKTNLAREPLGQEAASPCLEELRKKRDTLMRTFSSSEHTQKKTEKTKVNSTAESGESTNCMKSQNRMPQIQVNEFVAEECLKDKQPKFMRELKLIPRASPVALRKSSLKKVERKSTFVNFEDARRYRNLSAEVNMFIQDKLQKNHYTGLLTTLSRKTCNVMVNLKPEAIKSK